MIFNHIRRLKDEGKKVGIIRPNIIRPFPTEAVKNAIKGAKNLIIAERADTPGVENSYLSGDIKSIIHNSRMDINTQTLIYGLYNTLLLLILSFRFYLYVQFLFLLVVQCYSHHIYLTNLI